MAILAFTVYSTLSFIIVLSNAQPALSSNVMLWLIGLGITFVIIELTLIANKIDKLIKTIKRDKDV